MIALTVVFCTFSYVEFICPATSQDATESFLNLELTLLYLFLITQKYEFGPWLLRSI